MKYIVVALSLINGAWMLADGIHVIVKGKYIGPDKPGLWASLVGLTGIDVFRLGPVFVVLGIVWLVFAGLFVAGHGASRGLGIVLSILTLWYLPFGSVISLIVLLSLIFFSKT